MIRELTPWVNENFTNALVPVREYGVGPNKTWKFELRISGPAVADPATLRALAGEITEILDSNPMVDYARTDWRQRVQKIVPDYNQERARYAAVTRDDIAGSTKRAFDGIEIGLYREADELIPIVLRHAEDDRGDVSNLEFLQVQPSMSTYSIPLAQVVDGVPLAWEDPMIRRRDRRRTIKVQANPVLGVTNPTLIANVQDQLAEVELPPGYTMEWGGEHEDTVDSQAALIPGMVPAAVVILFLIVMLYNAFRPMFIIVLAIPFALIGITTGLLLFDAPFGFMSLLGAMSLAGMMIKNSIVLLDEVNNNLDAGVNPYDSIMNAALSRLRPVFLAAATTVLGVIPLLQDVFWVGMAVTIMAGLTFGTIITMILVPVLYVTFYGIRSPRGDQSAIPSPVPQSQTA